MKPRAIEDKVVTAERLTEICQALRSQGKRIVTTNGCFDILHWGHLKYLHEARALGDVLVCGINSDRSVRALNKGADRPLVAERYRALQVAALESVDWVIIFDEATPDKFIELVSPAVHAKGADYAGKTLPEQATVERRGGKIAFLPLSAGFSTTALVEKIRKS